MGSRSRRFIGVVAAALAVVLLVPGQAFADTVTQVQDNVSFDRAVAMDGVLYFNNNGGLWRSDGTSAGTTPVTTRVTNVSAMTPIGSTLWFAGQDANGVEVWKSDGTDAGT